MSTRYTARQRELTEGIDIALHTILLLLREKEALAEKQHALQPDLAVLDVRNSVLDHIRARLQLHTRED